MLLASFSDEELKLTVMKQFTNTIDSKWQDRN